MTILILLIGALLGYAMGCIHMALHIDKEKDKIMKVKLKG